jgi:hypothetical protein
MGTSFVGGLSSYYGRPLLTDLRERYTAAPV